MPGVRTVLSPANLVWLIFFIFATMLSGSQALGQGQSTSSEELVLDVQIKGNRNVPVEKILRHIQTRKGRPFDIELISKDIRRLNQTRMFVDIKPSSQRVPGGRIVIFEVLERPFLNYIKFIGNESIQRRILLTECNLKVGDAADPFAVEEARYRIEEFYHERGYARARVSIHEGSKIGDLGAVFVIHEGEKQKILWTDFVGNTIASDARLRTQIKSKPGFCWVFQGEVKQSEIDEDVNRLTAYYRGLGFFRARVGRELNFDEGSNWLKLTFVIDEGPRYKIRNISFMGHTKFGDGELKQDLKLAPGNHFNQSEMEADVSAIQEKYGSQGYIFADIKADPRFLEEPGFIDLVYNVTEGDRYRVGRINVRIDGDTPHTKITTVLNRISLQPGDIVDIRELRKSERRLRACGLFEVDMASGVSPKIVFSPPEEDASVAKRPTPTKRSGKLRGQSPDARPYSTFKPIDNESVSNDRAINLTANVSPLPPQNNERRDTSKQPQPFIPNSHPVMIIRGQLGSDQGRSVPTLPRNSQYVQSRYSPDRYTSQPPQSDYNPVPNGQSYPAQTNYQNSQQTTQSPSLAQTTAPTNSYNSTQTWGGTPTPPPQHGHDPATREPVRVAGVQSTPSQLWPNQGLISGDGPVGNDPRWPDDPTRYIDLEGVVSETRTGRLMFGVGVNSEAGLVGSIVLDEQNFDWTRFPSGFGDIRDGTAWRGAGQRFRLEAVPGTEVQRYMINFQEPYLLNSSISLGLSGYFFDRNYRYWNEERVGGRVSMGYQFNHDLSLTGAFRGMKINVNNPVSPAPTELTDVVGDSSLYGFGLQLTHDTRDSSFLPTEGHYMQLGVEQVIGTYQYTRGEVDLRRYLLLHQRPDGSGRHVLSFGGRMSVTGNDTPIYEHYFAGGFSTIRGFAFRGASPHDPATGVEIGGEFMLLASLEYLFPITADDMLRGVVFCDTGTVEPTINDWDEKYRVAPGFGLRITIPAMGPAPIALDFAFPVEQNEGDRIQNFSFFVGFGR